MMGQKKYTLGVFYGTEELAEKLAKRFVGHLLNDDEFCKACELLDQNVNCDKCREHLPSFASSLYFYEQMGQNMPDFVEDPSEFLPETIPPVDYIMVVGIHQDLLSGLPDYLKDKGIKAVIVPLEDPKWVPPGLQVQVLKDFQDNGIQAAFPKPFCSLSKEFNEYNKIGFHLTESYNYIHEFIDYFKIGEPIVSFLLDKNGKAIEDVCVIQCAPCGSTFFITQQLKGKYFNNGHEISLNERISKAHHSFPCSASMDQDSILKESPLHVGGYLVRNAIRKELGLEEHKREKLKYVIK
ncbi:MAG: DUF166 domain-containing protein [Promethearchaeota archaeon]